MTSRFELVRLLERDRPFLRAQRRSRSTSDILRMSERLARDLEAHGLRRVALVADRVDETVAAIAACEASACDVLLLRSGFSVDHPNWKAWAVQGLLRDELKLDLLQVPPPGGDAGGRVLVTTSGTTGTPKVVVHDPRTLASRALRTASGAAQATWLLTYHPGSFAGLQVVLTALVGNGELIAADDLSAPSLAKACKSAHPTHVSGTPTFWRSLLMCVPADERNWPLQHITLGGEVADQPTLDHVRAAFPKARISQIYASSEAGALFAVHDGRSGFPARWLEEGTEGSRLRIRDAVLEIRSPRAMLGYLGSNAQPVSTQDGWLTSGDLVEVVGDRVMFRGRADDVINVGGAKVLPEEVETTLRGVDGVHEVKVYGQRNPIVGAIVCADVVAIDPSRSAEIRAAIVGLAPASLRPHQVPRVVRFVEKISTSLSGKRTRVT